MNTSHSITHDQKAPFFSVIIPTFNRADVVFRAIQSILNQTFEDFELIIIDDGSTDNTRDIIQAIDDPRLRYVYQENKGVSAARNRGASVARGQILTFLDSDDEALPEWLECFAHAFNRKAVGIVCAGVTRIGEQIRQVVPAEMGPMFNDQVGLFLVGAFALRRELFLAVGGYADGLGYAENTEFALRLIPYAADRGWLIHSFSTALVNIYDHHQHRATGNNHLILQGATYILHRHNNSLCKSPQNHGNYWAIAGVSALKLGKNDEARRYFRSAVLAHPWNWRHYGRLLLTLIPLLGRRFWFRNKYQLRNGSYSRQ
ncbi:MAG: glycosyltransferase family 2 protein [Anaerolineae bacterium]|nr:glycosyltransferase family 2 protein [Anaerolineae bacterium]